MKAKWISVGLLYGLLTCFPAHVEPQSGDQWTFQIAPYAWLAGQKGTAGTLPGLPLTDVDVDFYDDVLGNIKGALFLVGETRKGRWGVTADIAYTQWTRTFGTTLGYRYLDVDYDEDDYL